jgi:hypothetical protein
VCGTTTIYFSYGAVYGLEAIITIGIFGLIAQDPVMFIWKSTKDFYEEVNLQALYQSENLEVCK